MSVPKLHVLALALALMLDTAGTAAQAQAPSPAAPQTPAAGVTVKPVTVQPSVKPEGQVVASTDAASLASPNFTDKDAEDPPLAVSIGPNAALGRQSMPNTPVGGLLASNPDLGGGTVSTRIGVTVVK